MSKSNASLELSEYFNNEDSNGYRLAEFLQKRRGGVQSQKLLFAESEPLRLSVEVQLEKLPHIVQNNNDRAMEPAGEVQSQPEKINSVNEKTIEDVQPEDAQNVSKVVEVGAPAKVRKSVDKAMSTSRIVPPFAHVAAVRKSGGISPSDRLRRLSLRRLSKLCGGRRTLLREFEDTMTDTEFSPQICSTPLSQLATDDNADPVAKPSTNVENITPNISQGNSIPPNEGTISWSVSPAKSLENKGANLRRMMESIVETTLKRVQNKDQEDEAVAKTTQEKTFEVQQERNFTLRRTFTLEKGQKPGQVILTPEAVPSQKSIAMDISGFMQQSQKRNSSQSAARTPEKRSNCSHISHKTSTSNRCSHAGEEVGVTNITQQGHHRSAGLVDNALYGCDHFTATKHMADMDITPQENHMTKSFNLSPKNTGNSPHNVPRTPRRVSNRSQLTISFNNTHVACSPESRLEKRSLSGNRGFAMLSRSNCGGGLSSSKMDHEKCQTKPPPTQINQRNVSCIIHANNETIGEDELVIPETQDQQVQGRNSIVIESPNHQIPFVVIPVSQTFNSSSQKENHNAVVQPCGAGNTANVTDKSFCRPIIFSQPKSTPPKSQSQKTTVNDNNSSAADNLKLTDILTDDEDEPNHSTMTETNRSNSQMPLNLAGSTRNGCTTRLRTRSVSRHKNALAAISTETAAETPPLSLSNHAPNRKRIMKRRQATLNKAPGVPLNGEEFAKELARMSNYEILDLRKRNSLGHVFAICGRNSLRQRDQAVKKQVKLDDEIEMELLRRNMQMEEDDAIKTSEVALTEVNTEADDTESEEVYPPAPQEFCDVTGLQKANTSEEKESSLADEKSCDRICFITRKDSPKRRKKKSMPDVLQHYLKVSKKFSDKKRRKRRSVNNSRRSLYTGGFSDSEEATCNSSNEKITENNTAMTSMPYVPSPPRSESDEMLPLRVVSPPPPLSASLENLQKTGIDTMADQTGTQPPPPPKDFETDSGVETNSSSQSQQTVLHVGENRNDDDVFKKPLPPPPPKRKGPGRKKAAERLQIVSSSSDKTVSEISSDTSSEGALRRSKRSHVPLTGSAPLFQLLFQNVLNKQFKAREKKESRNKEKLRDSVRANVHSLSESSGIKAKALSKKRKPLAVVPETAVLDVISHENAPTNGKKKSRKIIPKVTRKPQTSNTLECSRISMATPPPLDHFNNVFDHLRNNSQTYPRTSEMENQKKSDTKQQMKLRVRVARIKMTNIPKTASANTVKAADVAKSVNNISHCSQQTASDNFSTVSSTNDSRQSNFELISWLKNITDAEQPARNDDIFKEMRISSACNLCFTELQGIEYAFYDTDDKASLGYLRFKPRQIKSRKRAKRYHLHFVTLVGHFRITANDKESIVGPGDLVAIEKSIYYDIENTSDDIGILMVIKK